MATSPHVPIPLYWNIGIMMGVNDQDSGRKLFAYCTLHVGVGLMQCSAAGSTSCGNYIQQGWLARPGPYGGKGVLRSLRYLS